MDVPHLAHAVGRAAVVDKSRHVAIDSGVYHLVRAVQQGRRKMIKSKNTSTCHTSVYMLTKCVPQAHDVGVLQALGSVQGCAFGTLCSGDNFATVFDYQGARVWHNLVGNHPPALARHVPQTACNAAAALLQALIGAGKASWASRRVALVIGGAVYAALTAAIGGCTRAMCVFFAFWIRSGSSRREELVKPKRW